MGGGGGAGGYLAATNVALVNTTYDITIGSGGFGAPAGYPSPRGSNGSDTIFAPLEFKGNSVKFPGSGVGLSFTNINNQITFGTENFTIEFWVNFTNPTSTTSYEVVLRNYNTDPFTTDYFYLGKHPSANLSGAMSFWVANYGGLMLSDPTLPSTGWSHFAIVRNGNTWTMYRNGTAVHSVTSSVSMGTRNNNLCGIGVDLTGYVSNLRVVKGIAVYTAAFTPPSAPLTAITNTSLLTAQETTFTDNSTNAFSLTASVNTISNPFTPFTAVAGTSIGGGGGASTHNATAAPAGSGGSGGGGSGGRQSNAGYGGDPGKGTPGQGNNGAASGVSWYPGGGGGAGAAASQTGSQTAHGGAGISNSILGPAYFWAGGGAGAGYSDYGGNGGAGGGGGGAPRGGSTGLGNTQGINPGANATVGSTGAQTNVAGGDAGANTGGGGGGGSHYNSTNKGGNGGSGVVIIRYADSYVVPTKTTGSPIITSTSGYRIYMWTSSGSVTFGPVLPTTPTVEYLVVAGGGGGGTQSAGGGGAGGVLSAASLSLTPGTAITVTVGGGGAGTAGGGNGDRPAGSSGNASVFGTITSAGGGGGGSYRSSTGQAGVAGASGGGGGIGPSTGGTGGSGTSGQGFGGGTGGADNSSTNDVAGGGGGAGGAGISYNDANTAIRGNGGIGTATNIISTSTAVARSLGQVSGTSVYFAGGGGGATHNGPRFGTGGLGGGGAGGNTNLSGSNGTPYTGGGGGGGSEFNNTGGTGGSGVVIIRYPSSYAVPASTTGSPIVTTSDGYRTYIWTSSGSITL
jgi:hypothetical protein